MTSLHCTVETIVLPVEFDRQEGASMLGGLLTSNIIRLTVEPLNQMW